MRSETLTNVIEACRFCFMCRHLATVGNVTFRESDTPRGTALILDKVRRDPALLQCADYVECLYRNALSGACRKHCVSSYDEVGLVLAAREDIVAVGAAPKAVAVLAETLERTGNPFGAAARTGAKRRAATTADVLYFVDPYAAHKQPEIAAAFLAAAKALGVKVLPVEGVDAGKALLVLGYRDQAAKAAKRVRKLVAESGCKTVVTSCPACFDAFKNDYPRLGAGFGAKVAIEHSGAFLLKVLEAKKPKISKRGKAKVFYLDSDFLRNYNGIVDEPRALLRALGLALLPFGTNPEESCACGEGAVVSDVLHPGVVSLLRARVEELADDPAHDTLVVASPYTKHVLVSGVRPLKVKTLDEVVAERIG
ncbi:MAG: hypothetical protein A3K19_10875 [Lentisphaerae bacterium RIFOXYB12_FULL_65_16]|nr:MAG: hypothetical protein A3K18_28600 [Lentisphaerae bacterium RIFOXYA12_64_32]OGV87890.1 MAG: hypothetical protein A3K19_10875 [Lentisphaerae bacterium RIFOXYB12_FULL_65_16]